MKYNVYMYIKICLQLSLYCMPLCIYAQKVPAAELFSEYSTTMQHNKEAEIGGAVLKSVAHSSGGLLASYLASWPISKTAYIAQNLKDIDPLLFKEYTNRSSTRIKLTSAVGVLLGGLVWAAAIQPLYFAYRHYQINKKYASQLPGQTSNSAQSAFKGPLFPAYMPLVK